MIKCASLCDLSSLKLLFHFIQFVVFVLDITIKVFTCMAYVLLLNQFSHINYTKIFFISEVKCDDIIIIIFITKHTCVKSS